MIQAFPYPSTRTQVQLNSFLFKNISQIHLIGILKMIISHESCSNILHVISNSIYYRSNLSLLTPTIRDVARIPCLHSSILISDRPSLQPNDIRIAEFLSSPKMFSCRYLHLKRFCVSPVPYLLTNIYISIGFLFVINTVFIWAEKSCSS